MGYAKTASWAALRSRTRLEQAMRERDVNGNELAKLAGLSPQVVSNVRRGKYSLMREETAQALERALRRERGDLFDYDRTIRQ